LRWLRDFPFGADEAPGLLQAFTQGRWWLAIAIALLLAALLVRALVPQSEKRGGWLTLIGACGIVFLALQGLAITFSGWTWTSPEAFFGPLATGQPAMGAGAITLGVV